MTWQRLDQQACKHLIELEEDVRAASEFSASARIGAGALAGIEATAALPPCYTLEEVTSGAIGEWEKDGAHGPAKSSDAKREGRGSRVVGSIKPIGQKPYLAFSASPSGMDRCLTMGEPRAAPSASMVRHLCIVGSTDHASTRNFGVRSGRNCATSSS